MGIIIGFFIDSEIKTKVLKGFLLLIWLSNHSFLIKVCSSLFFQEKSLKKHHKGGIKEEIRYHIVILTS